MSSHRTGAVNLTQLTEELDALFEGTSVYVNRKTGEITAVMDSELSAIEDGEEGFEPESGEEMLQILQSIVESTEWVAMPDKFEIHEWQLMSDFADSVGGHTGDQLARAIRRSGAFRMFKDAVFRHGIEDRWFEFKRKAVERIAVRALEAEGIPYYRRGRTGIPL